MILNRNIMSRWKGKRHLSVGPVPSYSGTEHAGEALVDDKSTR